MEYLHYFDLMDQLDENEEYVRERKVYKKCADPFSLCDDDFKTKYRFTKI